MCGGPQGREGALCASRKHTGDSRVSHAAEPSQKEGNTSRQGKSTRATSQLSRFQADGDAISCGHYKRRCLVKCSVCSKFYPCHRCHDVENPDHEMDRSATDSVKCTSCNSPEQCVGANCRYCGVEFGKYFCKVCVLYEDDEMNNIYHCDKCGICRVGKGVGIDQFHCDRCGSCVPLDLKDSHPCLENGLKRDCPICLCSLGGPSSRQVLLLRCGHAMHEDCFSKHTASSYRCPLCFKSVTDMAPWFRAVREEVAKELPLPAPYCHKKSEIFCFDCEKRSETHFHFTFHECNYCAGYNTRTISVKG